MAKPNPTDLRVRRTHRLLWQALVELIAEKQFDKITVQHICDRAMVHRTTFYKHYLDKYDLLEQGVVAHFNQLTAAFEAPTTVLHDYSPQNPPTWFVRVFEHAAENRAFYHILLAQSEVTAFRKLLRTYLVRHAQMRLAALTTATQALTVPADIIAEFSAGALMNTLVWWIEQGCPHEPRQMAQYMMQLLDYGSFSALGRT